MITAVHGPLICHPEQWVLVFDRKPINRWVGWLVPGEYKHVRAYGYVPFLHVWLFHDANLAGIEVWVAADGEPADAMAAAWTSGDCDVVLMPRRAHANRSPIAALSGWCVPHVKRLIGLRSSALRPSTLFAECLRNGGKFHGLSVRSGSNAGLCAGAGSDADAGPRTYSGSHAGPGSPAAAGTGPASSAGPAAGLRPAAT